MTRGLARMRRVRVRAVVLAAAVLLAGAAGEGACFICDRRAEGGWFCANADPYGYRTCAPSRYGCANWEPLCESGWIADVNCFWTGQGWVCYAF